MSVSKKGGHVLHTGEAIIISSSSKRLKGGVFGKWFKGFKEIKKPEKIKVIFS